MYEHIWTYFIYKYMFINIYIYSYMKNMKKFLPRTYLMHEILRYYTNRFYVTYSCYDSHIK